jgi:hypothetical protein
MSVASAGRSVALNLALCIGVSITGAGLGWSGQSQPPQKDQAGAQAGSSGKTRDPMGSKGSTESPLRSGDSGTTKDDTSKDKTTKKKKGKKPAPAKSS